MEMNSKDTAFFKGSFIISFHDNINKSIVHDINLHFTTNASLAAVIKPLDWRSYSQCFQLVTKYKK